MSEHRMLSNCLLLLSEHDSSKGRWPGFAQSGSLFRSELLYIGTWDAIQVYPCSSSSSPLHSCWTLHLLLFEHCSKQNSWWVSVPDAAVLRGVWVTRDPPSYVLLVTTKAGHCTVRSVFPWHLLCMRPLVLLLMAMLWSSIKCSLEAELMLKLQNCEPKLTSFLY